MSAWPPVVEVEWSHNGVSLTELSSQVDTVHMYCTYNRFCGPGADLQPGLGVQPHNPRGEHLLCGGVHLYCHQQVRTEQLSIISYDIDPP